MRFGIAHNQIRNYARRRCSQEVQVPETPGETSFFARLESRDDLEKIWEEEWQHAVIRQCVEEIRQEFKPRTIEAFWFFAVEGKPADDVARELDTTSNNVFVAKHRVLRRIRDLIPLMEHIW